MGRFKGFSGYYFSGLVLRGIMTQPRRVRIVSKSRGSGQKVMVMEVSRVGSVWVGSGRVGSDGIGSNRVGSGRVGSVGRVSNLAGSVGFYPDPIRVVYREMIRPAKSPA